MSVHKNRRTVSKLEFYHTARKLRKEITELVLRDFGIHSRGKGFKTDKPEGYYDELIAEFSKNVRLILRNLMWHITAGNTVYPINKEETQIRRNHQTAAIIDCEQLQQEFMYCKDVLPVKASIFAPYIEQIEFEIKLLKGWRKANSKLEEQFAEKQKGREKQE